MALIEPSPFRGDDPLQKLLDRYLLSGDDLAMEEVVSRTRGKLLAVARRIGKPQDAEDAVQTAYFSLLRKRGERLEAPVLPWLLTAVVRVAYRQKAVNQRQHDIARRLSRPPRPDSPLAEVANAEEAARVRREISHLPAKYRDPIVLRLLMGLSTAETAELLDRPEATVRTQLRRARLLLQSRWSSPVVHGVMFLPWILADSGRAVSGAISGSGLAAPALLMTVAAAGFLGGIGGGALVSPPDDRTGETAGARSGLHGERDRARADLDAAGARRDRAVANLAESQRRRDRSHEAVRALERRIAEEGPRFVVPLPAAGFPDELALVNWEVLGENLVEFQRLLVRILAAIERDEMRPPAWDREKERRNRILLREAAKVWSVLPAHANTLPHTHPLFMANAMTAALDYAGLPLSVDQADRIVRELTAFALADGIRRRGYPEGTLDLTRLREESEAKERCLSIIRGILTAAQRDALFPETTEGRVGLDLYSAGLLWTGVDRVRSVTCTGPGDLASRLTAGLLTAMQVTESEREAFGRIVSRWVDGLPPEAYCTASAVHVDMLHRAARATERLLESLRDELPPNAKRTEVIRFTTAVILPVRVAANPEEK